MQGDPTELGLYDLGPVLNVLRFRVAVVRVARIHEEIQIWKAGEDLTNPAAELIVRRAGLVPPSEVSVGDDEETKALGFVRGGFGTGLTGCSRPSLGGGECPAAERSGCRQSTCIEKKGTTLHGSWRKPFRGVLSAASG
jgi:hypothetical protein